MKIFYLVIFSFCTATFCNDLSRNLQLLDLELVALSNLLPKIQRPALLTQEQKRASDYSLALKIAEIAGREAAGLKGSKGFLKILDELNKVDNFAEEKRDILQEFIRTFKQFLVNDLKLPEKEEDKGRALRTFWVIKDNLLQPSEKFIEYHNKLSNSLKSVFFDDSFLDFHIYPTYTNVAQSLQTLLISSLAAQRLRSAQIDKEASDAAAVDALGYTLSLLEGMGERNQDIYNKVFEQFDFLRLRPNFQKFERLLESDESSLKPILNLFLNPKSAGFAAAAGDAFVGKQYVKPATEQLFYSDSVEAIATRFGAKKPVNELIASLLQWFNKKY